MVFSNREYEDRQRLGFTNENIDLEYRLPTYDMDANYIRIVHKLHRNCMGIVLKGAHQGAWMGLILPKNISRVFPRANFVQGRLTKVGTRRPGYSVECTTKPPAINVPIFP